MSRTGQFQRARSERVALGLIESAADRVAMLKRLLDVESARTPVSTGRVTELAAEIRQNEANIHRWVEALDPDMERKPRSEAHQRAAYARWHGAGVNGPA